VELSGLFTLYCHVLLLFSEQVISRVGRGTEWFIYLVLSCSTVALSTSNQPSQMWDRVVYLPCPVM
jgi:hypothetical protein